jgi:hypothetical protein
LNREKAPKSGLFLTSLQVTILHKSIFKGYLICNLQTHHHPS